MGTPTQSMGTYAGPRCGESFGSHQYNYKSRTNYQQMTTEHTHERLLSIIRSFLGRRMLVIGDAIADQFIYGAISRISREAPVLILHHEQTETVPGGAANCAINLSSLGAKVSLV